ncbi:MAG: FHA domain-containing protein [Thermoguttaceae bacterium]
MDAKLLVVAGKASKGSISLKLPTVIGRAKDATLTVAHRMISRKHCEIYEVDGLLMIRDLGSLNGTVVDKQRIKVAPLPPDGQFSIGPLTFKAEYQYDGPLDKLPAPVLDSRQVVPPPGAESESPDFESVDEAVSCDTPVGSVAAGSTVDNVMTGLMAKQGKTISTAKTPLTKEKKPHAATTHSRAAGAKSATASPAKRQADAPTERVPAAATAKKEPVEPKPAAKAAPNKESEEDPFDAFLNELG